MSNEQIDLRTPLQRQRDERNKKIYQMYKELKNNLPEDVAEWSIMRNLAERYNMKAQGVRVVVKKMKEQESIKKL